MQIFIKEHIRDAIELKKTVFEDKDFLQELEIVCYRAIEVYKRGNKILTAGNGGSAADAQHIVGELVNSFYFKRPALSAIALTTDSSILTSIANDDTYNSVFSRQIQANGCKGDMFIGITTSGNSQSILTALEECKKKEIITVCLTGNTGGKAAELSNYCLRVPSSDTPRIQEIHIMLAHIICAAIEKAVFGGVE